MATKKSNTKYVVICGGAISGLGKGVTISSIALLLKNAGFHLSIVKIDPYLNQDAGTMNPYEHGECFVLDDGGEVDLDLGNYERFLDVNFTQKHNITSGKIYRSILEKERKGEYLGHTVQVVPHVTREISEWIEDIAKIKVEESGELPELVLIEVGGTVGDLESTSYFEAIRHMRLEYGEQNLIILFLTFVLTIASSGEQKTKPTQNGLKDLRSAGLTPDFVICRSDKPWQKFVKERIAFYANLKDEFVINIPDVTNILDVPLLLEGQKFPQLLCEKLKIAPRIFDVSHIKLYKNYTELLKTIPPKIITIVGKYTSLQDAYLSVKKSLVYSGYDAGINIKVEYLESIDLEEETRKSDPKKYDAAHSLLSSSHGIIIAGGFGNRGTEGKKIASEHCRINKIPFLGICYGFQLALINFAEKVLGLEGVNSEEIDPQAKHLVVCYLPDVSKDVFGGTLRKGAKITKILDRNSLAYKLYGKDEIKERHRHRYEANMIYRKQFEDAGLVFTGIDEKDERLSIFELKDHPYYVGVQFHPEFKSRFYKPAPIFLGLVLQVAGKLEERLNQNNGILKYSEEWKNYASESERKEEKTEEKEKIQIFKNEPEQKEQVENEKNENKQISDEQK